ncbi:S8 family serine peptidase [Pontibacter cellulosilyticus]|uniref:S8 family serine peptidase n=1 Tax=Pontibacter cellulosilyticus TaxID=1720253 RepID=A0A923N3K2_9BACT|nr:S8 family serine peptidase [Pontibacter cellulosilyticus]MBC5991843.1 S8 family serine peptidase [Pontibacter cellulosilyticus]
MTIKNGLKRTVSCFALASAVTLAGCQKEELMENQFESNVDQSPSEVGKAIAGQYIVVFKNGNNGLNASGSNDMSSSSRAEFSSLRDRLMSDAKIPAKDLVQKFDGVINGFAARLSDEQLAEIRNNPNVAYIEQDRAISLGKNTNPGKGSGKDKTGGGTSEPTPTEPAPTEPTPTPTEPAPTEPAPTTSTYTTITPVAGENLPWNIQRVGYGDGTGKTVWVIDSGVDTDHPDLNVDPSRSVSFIYGVTSVEDGYGHGTSVAGVIAAKNNGSGMIGVAANATVVALRVFDDVGGGTVSRAISAVNHVSMYAKPGDVVNMSLGAGISSTLDNAVVSAAAKGIKFAIAAGNSAVDCSGTSPARVDAPGVYTVSAMDIYNRLWSSSNYGAPVDFSAPGANVTVTTKGGGIGGGGYGTSFAAPHVAGVLLLRGTVYTQGTITGDKDNTPDPIASVK